MFIRAKVDSLTYKGLGTITSESGKKYFVENVWPGDEGKFEIVEEKKTYGFAKIKKLDIKSSFRKKAECEYQDKCGGCPWMIAEYSSQLKEKENILKSLLKKNKIECEIDPIIESKPLYYKNRIQIQVDHNEIGFFQKNTNNIVDIEKCIIANEKINEQINYLRSSKNLEDKKYFLDDDLDNEDIIHALSKFKQSNSFINEKMKTYIASIIEPSKYCLELFSGNGNFSEILAKQYKKIDAFDCSIKSPKDLENVNFIESNIYQKNFIDILENKYQVLFLDPPRSGLKNLNQIIRKLKSIKKIIYVSCDISTQLRDISKLENYRVCNIQPFDAYPQTPHLENILTLNKIKF